MPRDDELLHVQRIGQRKNIGGQFIGGVGANLVRLGSTAIATLVGGNAEVAVGKSRNLVSPSAVRFGKSV